MRRNVVRTIAVLAVFGAVSVAQPASAQYGSPRGHRPPHTQPYPGYPAPRGYGYNDPAFEHGYTDGYDKGLDDARDRDAYDPIRHRWYRSGDRGYGGWSGQRYYYRNNYRQGFRDGYDRGYRDGRSYRGNRRGGGWFEFGWRF